MYATRLHQSHGSAFISAAFFAAILAILVGGVLTYLTNEYTLNQQSHLWNQALHLSEAATEIGFAELNFQSFQGGTGFQSSRGWSNTSASVNTKTVSSFTNGLDNLIGSLSVTVSTSNSLNPVITAIGTATNSNRRCPVVARAVRATLYQSSIFPVGLMAKDKIDMNGNNVYVDSYDSSDITKSTGSQYDATKKQSNGNLASNGTFTNTLSIGNADIYGVAYTGVGGSVALGSGGSIGPTFVTSDRATTVAAGQANGWVQNDFNVDVSNINLPTGATSWTTPPGAVGSGDKTMNKDTTLGTGDYKIGDVTLNSSDHGDTLTIAGDVRLYVSGNVDVAGLGSIVINSGASLTVYVAGTVQIAGNGLINNANIPLKDQWYGLSTSTSWNIVGNGVWNGVIYAPSATVNFKGAGSSGDASGAVVADKVVMTGGTRFHYDESLRSSTTGSGYAVVSWQELRKVSGGWQP